MKRLFLLLIFSLVIFGLSERVYATTCAQAVVIPSAPALPFVSSLTCGTTNDITSTNSTTCGSGSYKGGYEAVYSWTPGANYNNVTIAYSGVTYTGIFLYQGCPTSGGLCLGNRTSSATSKTLTHLGTNATSGTTISLVSGVTYYIVIDTWPTPNSPCPGTMTINGNIDMVCTGTPDPGNTLSSATIVLSGAGFSLSLQNATPGTGVTYQWQSSPDGSDPWANFGTSVSTISASQTNDTYYRCQVTCVSNTGTSNPVLVSMCSEVTSYPYTESFDDVVFPPLCWDTSFTVAGTGSGSHGNWDRVIAGTSPTCATHSGAGMTRFNSFSFKTGARSILVTKELNLPTDYFLVKFWMYRDNGYTTNHDLVNVYYNTSPTATGAQLIGTVERYFGFAPVETTANQWYLYEFGLPAGSGGGPGGYVIFEGVSAYGNNIFIDDVEITPPSTLSGYVYDYDNNPLAGALVEKVGGISDITDINGFYSLIPLSSGSQNFKCSKTGYNFVMEMIDIPVGATVNQNFTLTNPEMTVEPGSIYAILGATATGSYDLKITNNGNGPLDWTATEISTASCEYTIELTDDYGDGWNGGTLDVMVNGTVVLDNITLLSADEAGPLYWTFNVSSGDEITTVFSAGSYSYECIYKIFNNLMAEVWWAEGDSGPGNITPGQLFGGCDLEWLSLDMVAGNVGPDGGTQTIIVTLDAAQTPPALAPGVTYTADILFTSGSGIEPVTIPVTLVVTDAGLAGPQDLKLFIVEQLTGEIRLRWNYIPLRDLEFVHFAIFKDNELFGTTTEDFYLDINTEPGVYCYKVYAIYEGNVFSDPSNVVCVPYPLGPGVPVANWALLLGGLLMVSFLFIRLSRRS